MVFATLPVRETDLVSLSDVLVTRLDVQDRNSINEVIEAAIARFGRIDVLINNAGFGQYGLFEAIPRENIQEHFNVNVFGVMDVTRAILPHFRKNKAGLIINLRSGAAIFTLPMISLHCASKFALEGFSESLAYELASQNIVVKIVESHGGVARTGFSERTAEQFAKEVSSRTTMTAARATSADDVAQVIYSAATDGTDQLRYLIGDDSRGFIKARREMSHQDYVDFMRPRFLPKS